MNILLEDLIANGVIVKMGLKNERSITNEEINAYKEEVIKNLVYGGISRDKIKISTDNENKDISKILIKNENGYSLKQDATVCDLLSFRKDMNFKLLLACMDDNVGTKFFIKQDTKKLVRK